MKFARLVSLLALFAVTARAESLPTRSADPYLGAIVVDAATGDVLFEDKADAQGYPASCIKLMDLLVILEKIEQGSLKLDENVTVTAESSKMGGSQVFLKEGEIFAIDELLYALMAIPNLISLIVLSPILVAETKTHLWELKD